MLRGRVVRSREGRGVVVAAPTPFVIEAEEAGGGRRCFPDGETKGSGTCFENGKGAAAPDQKGLSRPAFCVYGGQWPNPASFVPAYCAAAKGMLAGVACQIAVLHRMEKLYPAPSPVPDLRIS